VSAPLIAALTQLGTPFAFAVVIIWRLFPGGLPGMLNAWTRYRTTTTARGLVEESDADKRQAGVDMVRAVCGTGGGPDTQTAPTAQEQPPALPGDPPT